MAGDFDVVGSITVDDSGSAAIDRTNAGLDQMSSSAGGLQSLLMGVGTGFTIAFAQMAVSAIGSAASALTGFISDSIGAADKHDKALAQLNATLKSTSDNSDKYTKILGAHKPVVMSTIDDLTRLASKMSNKTLFTQDQYLAAETYMLQMGKIGKDVFPQAMQATADLATRMNVDLPSASQMVAKAIADPVMGIGRLNMAFKLFEPNQLKAIKNMAAHGQAAKAQTMILDALTKAVGGSATAAAEAGLGPWQLLGNKWEDIKDQVGNALIPAITNIATALGPVMDQVMPQLSAFLTTVVGPAFSTVSNAVGNFITQISIGAKPMDALNSALAGAGVSPATIKSIDDFAKGVGDFVAGIPKALDSVGKFVDSVGKFVGGVITFVAGGINAANTLPDALVKAVGAALVSVQVKVTDFMSVGTAIINNVITGVTSAVSTVSDALSKGVDAWITETGKKIADFYAGGTAIISNIVSGINKTIGDVTTALGTAISGWITAAVKVMAGFSAAGKSIIDGVIAGLNSGSSSLYNTIASIAGTAYGKFMGAISGHSPSRLFMEAGKSITSGLALGIQNSQHAPLGAMASMTSQITGASHSTYYQNKTTITNNFGINTYRPAGSASGALMQQFKAA